VIKKTGAFSVYFSYSLKPDELSHSSLEKKMEQEINYWMKKGERKEGRKEG